jgi:hypothetical protein
MALDRRHFLGFLLAAADHARPAAATPTDAGRAEPSESEWSQIKQTAEAFVRTESPSTVWPFEVGGRLRSKTRPPSVRVHYFPPFPLSLDNKPQDADVL